MPSPMTRPNRHRIQRQIIELAVSGIADAPAVQQQLAAPFWDRALPQLQDVFDRAAGPEEQCLTHATGDQIHQALKLLPDSYRQAIILTDLEQWSYEEVAQKMGCPVGTVRSRLHRGRQLLRQHLRQMQAEETVQMMAILQ